MGADCEVYGCDHGKQYVYSIVTYHFFQRESDKR